MALLGQFDMQAKSCKKKLSWCPKLRQNHDDTFGLNTKPCQDTKNHAHFRLTTLTMQLSCKEPTLMQRKHVHSWLTMQAQARYIQLPCKLSVHLMQTSGTLEAWLLCELRVGGLSFRGRSWGCLVSWGMHGSV